MAEGVDIKLMRSWDVEAQAVGPVPTPPRPAPFGRYADVGGAENAQPGQGFLVEDWGMSEEPEEKAQNLFFGDLKGVSEGMSYSSDMEEFWAGEGGWDRDTPGWERGLSILPNGTITPGVDKETAKFLGMIPDDDLSHASQQSIRTARVEVNATSAAGGPGCTVSTEPPPDVYFYPQGRVLARADDYYWDNCHIVPDLCRYSTKNPDFSSHPTS